MKEMQIGKIYSIKRDLSLKLERLKKDELEGKDVSEEMDEIKRKLAKRKTQFEKMTDEKEKGLYVIRASHKSVAELLGITENAVSIRMHRAEKALREKIEKEDLI
jgi:DNA-directed RNA polymerase specialized sigma24 family protein